MTAVDMAASIVPRSDQLNAEDLLAGARTVTITGVRRGASGEQPVDIMLAEFDRPFKPSKTVRRVLVHAWGPDAAAYVGRRMTIYRDPAVRFGGMDVGGIRISHLSHIDKRLTVALMVTRGKRAPYVVEPLAASPPRQPVSEPLVPTDEKDPDSQHIERGERPKVVPSQYRDEVLNPRTSAARLRQIRAEINQHGIANALVVNEHNDDEQLLKLVVRIGTERAAAEGGGPS